MIKRNLVELQFTDSEITNFGKSLYVLSTLKNKAENTDNCTVFGAYPRYNYFQFHDKFRLKLKVAKSSPRDDLYKNDIFYYRIFSKEANSRFKFSNKADFYFGYIRSKNKFTEAIDRLIENLSKYYFIISDFKRWKTKVDSSKLYNDQKYLICSSEEMYNKPYEIMSLIESKRLNKTNLPILVISLNNEIYVNDMMKTLKYVFKLDCQGIVVFD